MTPRQPRQPRRRNRRKKGEIDVFPNAAMAITPRAAAAPQTEQSQKVLDAGTAVIEAAVVAYLKGVESLLWLEESERRAIVVGTAGLAKTLIRAAGQIREKHTAAMAPRHRRQTKDAHWAALLAAIDRHEAAGRGRNEAIRAVFNSRIAASGQSWEAFRRAAYRRLAE